MSDLCPGRGYWTLCPGEVIVRFQTSICNGLSDREIEEDSREANKFPSSLPDAKPALVMSAVFLRSTCPALLLGALAGLQWQTARNTKVLFGVLGLSLSLLAVSSVVERFLLAFNRLCEHVLSVQYSLQQEAMFLTTRRGTQSFVLATNLLPGDIVHLKEGPVPADCRVLESTGLLVDDSFMPHRRMTASEHIVSAATRALDMNPKDTWGRICLQGRTVTAAADEEGSSVLDANCVALAATFVRHGSATAVVTRTGDRTAVCSLLARLSSFSLLQVLFSSWM